MQLIRVTAALVAAGQVVTAVARADERLADVRAAVSQWVDVEKAISSEALAWEEKKTLLKDLTAVARGRIESLQKSIAETDQATGAADQRRIDLVSKRDDNADLTAKISEFLVTMEARARGLAGRLPAPLREKVAPLMQRMPADSRKTELGVAARMQTVLGFMAEVQRFDTLITVGEELRDTGAGGAREVRTIHFGLGASYYVSADGADAGVGRSTDTGWAWEARPELAEAVREAIATAEGRKREARFVSLPVEVKERSR